MYQLDVQWVIPEKIHTHPPSDRWRAGNSYGRGVWGLWKSGQERGLDLKVLPRGVDFLKMILRKTVCV